MPKLLHIAYEEILVHLKEWTFYLTAIGMPLIFAAIGLLPQLQAAGQETPLAAMETVFSPPETITELTGYVDLAGLIETVPPEHAETLRAWPDETAAAAALARGEIVRYYLIPADYQAGGQIRAYSATPELLGGGDGVIRTLIRDNLLGRLNDPDLAERLKDPAIIDREGRPEPPAFSFIPAELDRRALTLAGLVVGLFAYLINVGGYLIVRSLKREKRARVLEVLITSTTPGQFIGGKLTGLAALSLLQAGLTLLAGGLVYDRAPQAGGPAGLSMAAIGLILPYLLLGYLAYCGSIMAVAAIWPDLPESGTLLAMARLLALSPLIGLVFILPNAAGPAAQLLTLNPLTSPLLMPFRLLISPVPGWQWAVGVLGLLLWAAFSIWLSTRLFRLNGLLTGRPGSPRLLWQAVVGG